MLGTMPSNTLICDTVTVAAVQPSDEFLAAAAAKVAAEKRLDRLRDSLAPLIAAEVARGVTLAEVGRKANYSPEHVRRIARKHGVNAAVERTPPPSRPRREDHN